MSKPAIKLDLNTLENLQRERKINEKTLSVIAKMDYTQIYRIKNGISSVSSGFVAGILKAFPDKKFDDFFSIT